MTTSFSTIRLIFAVMLEVFLVWGLETEEEGNSYGGALHGRISTLSRYPSLYRFYLDPTEEDALQSDKRSRLFVGKRFNNEYPVDSGEDYVVLPAEAEGPFAGFMSKKNHLFVGKRGSPRFVGKRSVNGERILRIKRYVGGNGGKDGSADEGNDDQTWKAWINDEDQVHGSDKRSRLFVGKRHRSESNEAEDKRSRLFVGRRAEVVDDDFVLRGRPTDDDGTAVQPMEADKRSSLFGEKRPSVVDQQSQTDIVDRPNESGEIGDKGQTKSAANTDPAGPDKRVRLFPGKRPAPGFVGKRQSQN